MRARVGGVVLSMSLSLLVAYVSSAAGQDGSRRYPTELTPYPSTERRFKPIYGVPVPSKKFSPERESRGRSWVDYFMEMCVPNFGIEEESDEILEGVCDDLAKGIIAIPTVPAGNRRSPERLEEGSPSNRSSLNDEPFVVPTVIIPDTLIEY